MPYLTETDYHNMLGIMEDDDKKIAAQSARIEELEQALEPLKKMADWSDECGLRDNDILWIGGYEGEKAKLTVGDVRYARRVLRIDSK